MKKRFEKIPVLLIGAGKIGFLYDYKNESIVTNTIMTHSKALKQSVFFQITKVVDSNKHILERVKKALDVDTWHNLQEVSPRFPMVVIATPTHTHLKILEDVIDLISPEIVILEKPSGLNLKEVLEIQQLVVSASIKIYVNYFRRYFFSSLAAQDFFRRNDFGHLTKIGIDGYGSLLNIFSHFIDLGLFIFGEYSFCSCTKICIYASDDRKIYSCQKCNRQYAFDNIGNSFKSIRMVVEFEKAQVIVDNNGSRVRIFCEGSNSQIDFHTKTEDLSNYQKIVYDSIAAVYLNNDDRLFFEGLELAILVHKFLDSIQSTDG